MQLIPMLINLLLPVAVDEVRKKMQKQSDITAEKASVTVPDAPVITAHEAAIPALQQVMAGAITSKTAWFSAFLLLAGFLEQNGQLISNIVPPKYTGLVIAGIGFITLLLRTITSSSLTEKSTPKE